MKRSQINKAVDDALAFLEKMRFHLPRFARWSPEDWKAAGPEYDEIRDLGLGWDVTDFGSGDFTRVGRTIFTLRNGKANDHRYPKTYAQKVMYMPEGQKSVVHYHREKREDIHNHSGGNILAAGAPTRLEPGEWVCVPPETYHQFWAEEGYGDVSCVGISSVCDDRADNFFWPQGTRFPTIEEDELARYVLCSEYHAYMER